MQTTCYIGLDVHKRTIRHCVKDGSRTQRRVVASPRIVCREAERRSVKQVMP